MSKLPDKINKQVQQQSGNGSTRPVTGKSPGDINIKAQETAESIQNSVKILGTDLLMDEYQCVLGFRVIRLNYNARTSTLYAVIGIDDAKTLCESEIKERLEMMLGQFPDVDQSDVKIILRITPNLFEDKKDSHYKSRERTNPILEEQIKRLQEGLIEPFYKITVNLSPDYGSGVSRNGTLRELVRIRLGVEGDTVQCIFSPKHRLTVEQRLQIDLQIGKFKVDIATAIEPLLAINPSLKFKTKFNGIGPSVVQLPGHATGDMYNVAAGLLLNPTRSVVISRQDPDFAHHDPARDANLKVYDQSEIISEFLYQTLPETERWRIKIIPVRGMKEGTERERLKRLSPGIPMDLERSMAQVAQVWRPEYCVRLCQQWGVRPAADDAEQPYDNHLQLWLLSHGLANNDLERKRIIVLWSRFSGKKGDLHPEHDTSLLGMRQLVNMAREQADVIIITGDKPLTDGLEGEELIRRKNKYTAMETTGGTSVSETACKVLDLTEFWSEPTTQTWCMKGNRAQQFRLYDYLHRIGKVKHLGMRSGILLATALLGYDTCYMEEPDSVGSKRMRRFEQKLSNLSLIRIGTPPTRTGKAIKEHLYKHWSTLARTAGKATSELAGSGTSPSYLSNIKYTTTAQKRGLRLEIIESRVAQYVERSDLKVKPDVTNYIKGFTKSELESIKKHLAWE